jgi:ribosomal protein S18 acetylase RimI-like enzyme
VIPIHDEVLEIRPVDGDGLDGLFPIYKACEDFLALGPAAAATPGMVRADFSTSQSEGGEFCAISLRDGTMIGVLDFVPGNFRGGVDTAFIALLMLALPYRRRGYGSRVLGLVESEVRRDPRISRIRIGVMVNNPSALQFWQNRGFRIYSGPERLPDQTTVYRMEKLLAPGGGETPGGR